MTTLTGKPAGAPASNQYGEFAVHTCTPKQASFIQSLLDTRRHNLPITDATTINKKHASRIIDELLKCPKLVPDLISDKQLSYIESLRRTRGSASNYHIVNALLNAKVTVTKELTREQAGSLITALQVLPVIAQPILVTEVGAYRHGEQYYSVRKSQRNDSLIAYVFNASTGRWEYANGSIHALRPEQRLTLSEAKEFGVQTGQCVHCGRTLTDPISIMAGLGTVCIKRYL